MLIRGSIKIVNVIFIDISNDNLMNNSRRSYNSNFVEDLETSLLVLKTRLYYAAESPSRHWWPLS